MGDCRERRFPRIDDCVPFSRQVICRRGVAVTLAPVRTRTERCIALLTIGTFVVLSRAVAAPPRSCKSNPKLVGACFVVHGRATYGPGTPALRIWPVGSRRILGVTAGPIADDADSPIVPKDLAFGAGKTAFGNFEVCPFTLKRAGSMQMVCVETVRKLSIR